MPQASDDLRDKMKKRFGDPVSDEGPRKFLRDAGYTLTSRWEWFKPGITSLGQMTREEFDCLLFMAHEWDFGGLAPQEEQS